MPKNATIVPIIVFIKTVVIVTDLSYYYNGVLAVILASKVMVSISSSPDIANFYRIFFPPRVYTLTWSLRTPAILIA
jgi:hypothetical protein